MVVVVCVVVGWGGVGVWVSTRVDTYGPGASGTLPPINHPTKSLQEFFFSFRTFVCMMEKQAALELRVAQLQMQVQQL